MLLQPEGRKLGRRWFGPRILVSYTASGLSEYVIELQGFGKTKRYHLNGLLLYNLRSGFRLNDTTMQTSHGTFLAIIGGLGGGEPGPRAVFLSSRREFSIAKGQGRYRAVGIILRRECRWESSRRAGPTSMITPARLRLVLEGGRAVGCTKAK